MKSDSGTMLDSVLGTRLRRMRKELNKLLGPAVYEDARISIYSPWGEPGPCVAGDVVPDKVALGQTDVSPEQLLKMDPDRRDLWRPFPATTLDDGDTDAPDEAADTDRVVTEPHIPAMPAPE